MTVMFSQYEDFQESESLLKWRKVSFVKVLEGWVGPRWSPVV